MSSTLKLHKKFSSPQVHLSMPWHSPSRAIEACSQVIPLDLGNKVVLTACSGLWHVHQLSLSIPGLGGLVHGSHHPCQPVHCWSWGSQSSWSYGWEHLFVWWAEQCQGAVLWCSRSIASDQHDAKSIPPLACPWRYNSWSSSSHRWVPFMR